MASESLPAVFAGVEPWRFMTISFNVLVLQLKKPPLPGHHDASRLREPNEQVRCQTSPPD
jgi:hypothetical protein